MSGGDHPLVFRTVDDLRSRVGTELGRSGWFRVDQGLVTAFAELTDDPEWIHTDIERAATGPFGSTIAHGYLTLALVPRFAAEVFRLELGGATLNYGLDRVRFPAPLHTGTHVWDTITLTSVSEHAADWSLEVRHVLSAEDEARPVCVADTVLLAQSAT